MDLTDDDYMGNIDVMDDDLYWSPAQDSTKPTPFSPQDAVFMEYLTISYFLKPKKKTLCQKAISRSQRLLVKKFKAEGISLQEWEEYFWSHRFSTMDPV